MRDKNENVEEPIVWIARKVKNHFANFEAMAKLWRAMKEISNYLAI